MANIVQAILDRDRIYIRTMSTGHRNAVRASTHLYSMPEEVDLLEAEKVRNQTRSYLDQFGWDVAEDEEAWRAHQKRRMAEDYADDEW